MSNFVVVSFIPNIQRTKSHAILTIIINFYELFIINISISISFLRRIQSHLMPLQTSAYEFSFSYYKIAPLWLIQHQWHGYYSSNIKKQIHKFGDMWRTVWEWKLLNISFSFVLSTLLSTSFLDLFLIFSAFVLLLLSLVLLRMAF